MKIAYIGEHHPTEGTYYRQRITVNRAEFTEINNILRGHYNETAETVAKKHIATNEQITILTYGLPLNPNQSKHYLKLTQLYIIAAHYKNPRITDNNTILLIKEKKTMSTYNIEWETAKAGRNF